MNDISHETPRGGFWSRLNRTLEAMEMTEAEIIGEELPILKRELLLLKAEVQLLAAKQGACEQD